MAASGRRDFLRDAGLGIAALTLGHSAQAQGRKVVIGLIGPGGMGTAHLKLLSARKDVEVAYVSDPDRDRRARRQRQHDAREHQRDDRPEQRTVHRPPPVGKRIAFFAGEHW